MPTHLFAVDVRSKTGPTVVVGLRIISAEQPDFPRTRSFALMLLLDPIAQRTVTGAPLGQAASLEDALDEDWVYENIDRFVDDCELFDEENVPIDVDLSALSDAEERAFWASERAPRARMKISVVDTRWIEHVERGMSWDSAAFDLIYD